ncbi:hypothetical protein ACFQPA_21860 [Halomarina halobia]|uniref:Uncharacterized protein n=1 Tax=Halomarina halobia TaxID=3033386 RepID=A0ABD6AFC1_9EURY|nr:hypothetical protein [Halomarina sp. PSR21]
MSSKRDLERRIDALESPELADGIDSDLPDYGGFDVIYGDEERDDTAEGYTLVADGQSRRGTAWEIWAPPAD